MNKVKSIAGAVFAIGFEVLVLVPIVVGCMFVEGIQAKLKGGSPFEGLNP